ncbi:T9SS sorting signal type C domain-containing protein [Flavobacterium sp. LPB0248]|uniref:GEVED domain-containing protein n=1 Tax=Flavobacterium sp. LPB0248 TaxID=2614441 RepID=UPI0015A57E29|nr:GEVED domain-containing protein [Flavobacterium sp. LPB0248]QLC67035.1 T9SS sorting signal type C domain-containing protein [Flavobacterium sp. LPB0248]
MFFVGFFVNAATYYSRVTNGNWNSASTWSSTPTGGAGTTIPGVNDTVFIQNGHTITVNGVAQCSSITFTGASATLTVNATLTVGGVITLNSATANNTVATIGGTSSLTCNSIQVGTAAGNFPSGTRTTILTSTISNLNISGNLIISSFIGNNTSRILNSTFNLTSGTTNIDGQIVTENQDNANNTTFSMISTPQSGTLLLSNATPFNLGGTGNTISLNGTTATVNYDGTNQTIIGGTNIAYRNLTISGSGEKTANGNLTVNGTLTTTSGTTLNMATNQLLGTPTTITNNGLIRTQNTSTTPIPVGLSWGGTVQYDGANQTISRGTYNNLTISGSGEKAAGGNLIVNGNLTTIVGTTLNMVTNQLSGTLTTIANGGIIRTQSTNATPIPTGKTWGGTVQYDRNDNSAQTVSQGIYNNLAISGSGSKTASGNLTVNNDFTLSGGTFVANNGTSYVHNILGNYIQTGGIFDFNAGTSGVSNVNIAGNFTNTAGAGSITTVGVVQNGIFNFNKNGIQTLTMPTSDAAIWVKYNVNAGSTLKLASDFSLSTAFASDTDLWMGELNVSGTIDFGTFKVIGSGGRGNTGTAKFILNSGASLITANAGGIDGSVPVATTMIRSFSSGANYTFNGTVAQVTSTGMPATVNNLTINNTHASGVTLSQATTASGNITIGTGSALDVSASNFAVIVGGNFASSGNYIPRLGTVTLNGSGAQSFNVSNFNNLTLSGSGTKSFTGTTTVGGALIINPGVNANLGNGQTHTANTLTLGTTQALPSTWGNTVSPALRKDDSFFTATTGIIRVASSTCTNFSSVAQITSVSLNNTVRTSSGTGSFEDLISPTLTTVVKGQSYALTVTGNTLSDQNGYYSVFFDWNNDGVFASSEYSQIGSIRNSNGADGKSASLYVTIPSGSGSVAGTVKMRIIGRIGDYNNTACAIGGTGQIEDYTISIQETCSGNFTPGQTNTSAASVCPNTPFTLSISNTIQDGATYTWQTSPNGSDSWTNAVPAPSSFFGKETFDTPNSDAGVYGAAVITGGQLVLTPAINSQYGAYVVKKTPGSNIDAFSVNFDYQIPPGGGADGFSLSYADDVQEDAAGGESGSGSGLIVEFDTYDNDGDIAGQGSRIRIKYAGTTLYNSSINAPSLRPTTGDTPVLLRVDAKGKLTLTINNSVVVSNLALPAGYLSSNKSLWRFKFAARTGGINDKQIIDNLLINYLDITASGPTFTTTQTTKTYYRVGVSCGSSLPNYSQAVMVDMISATISAMTATACSAVAFSSEPLDGTNGTIPANTKYTWTTPSMPTGLTGGAGNTVASSTITGTLTNTTSTAQTAIYTVTPITGSCTGVPFTLTVTVNPIPTAPSTSQTNVSCGTLGSITLTNLPTGDWKVYLNDQSGAHQYSRQNAETDLTIHDLPVGTYNFTVEDIASTCISSVASVQIIDISTNTTWNGSAWSNGVPDGSKSVTISSVLPNQPFPEPVPSSPISFTACSLTVSATDGDVIIPSEMTLTVTNGITSNGKLVFESGSSLLQGANAINSGNISYKRKVDLTRYDVVYWASPVTDVNMTMAKFSPNTLWDKYHYWDAANGQWVLNSFGTKVMKEAEGYSIRAPQNFDLTNPSTFEGIFVGEPNNGDVSVPVLQNKLNLIGNPYPSPISAKELMLDNKTELGSLYFWSHNSPPQIIPGTNTFQYISSDFVVFNGVGSTRVNDDPATEFKGFIGAGQAFFTISPAGATAIKFNNNLRKGSSENTQFYKPAEASKTESNRLWLNIANSQGAFKQILIGYVEGATNGIDLSYDATTRGGTAYIDFYSISESRKLTIQGRALPFDNTDVVPLGYKSGVDDKGDRNFTISIDHADGFFATQPVYLEDKALGKIIDLRKENYTFFSLAGSNTTRFSIRYTNKTLGTDDFENLENTVLVSVKDKAVNITSSKETIKEVNVYNIGAQLLYSNNKVNASDLQIKNLHSSDQVLLVKITLENGHTFTKKVIFSNL